MRCCVQGCKNDSRQLSKSNGITFHVFPNEPSIRTAWLRALGKEQWEPRERSAVCSKHFLNDDLYETKSGLRKVRVGAVPIIARDTLNCDFKEASSLKVCRICLVMDNKLYSIKLYNLQQAFEHLTGLPLAEDKLPQSLCVECATRLLNSNTFRNKCIRANSLMLEIIKQQDSLTKDNIQTINRDKNKLSSVLSPQHYTANNFDLQVVHDDTRQNVTPLDEELMDIVVKDENSSDDIFIAENKEFEQNLIEQNEIRQDDIGQEIEGNEDTESQNDADFITSDKDYSSDDSLPLEKTRKKKKIEKKVAPIRKKKLKKDPTEPKIDRRRKAFLNDDLNETLFTIINLSVDEQLAEIHKRQDSANYKNSAFKCKECFKGFLDEDAYNTHMTRHTDQCGDHECKICKTHFKHQHALRKHITAHHTQRFSCNQCPYVTTHRQTARLHERWHKGTKYQCPHCQDEFVFTTYMGHIRIKHPSDFVCELCGYSFVSAKGIQLHKKLKHHLDDGQIPADGPYCELCNVRFVSQVAYKRHVSVSARHNTGAEKEARESNKPKKGRKSKETKEREKRAREKIGEDIEPEEKRKIYPSQMRKAEGPMPCEQCGLQLEDSRAYHNHFRRMHPDKNRTNYPSMKSPCMCEVCGRIFQSFALLKDHTWVHTGERPFQCDLCEKSFRMKQRLVAHRRVHCDQKPLYLCTLCGKHFSTHSNRQRHMFIHTGLKPFKCEMCGKGFKHASEKRAHVTYVHLKKPWPKRTRGKRRTDGRQVNLPPQPVPTSASEMDIQPVWPACDAKLNEMNMMDDKPMYYNLKI